MAGSNLETQSTLMRAVSWQDLQRSQDEGFLKCSQSRAWTSFIEAVTATGHLLKPGIIFKGKELQQQWFVDELKQVADWHYITSENGRTDNHIAVEWLKEVYLPQTQPEDESDARLIILDGHRSHVSVRV
ncbi:hypothetical protein HZS61_004573 [Fusarium oxysporum f. sp. conglutinans]|uniref:DDE-1 domain-containing protein n=1 Tax=Fusarium oxysporum f. sp. conglutinans TaxID=100902 RepID=A0A8H6GD47_FUSOX|nr:hypothetical protein HZS61_004573 [Fusarium oxysporum f. sp. conglutinans]